MKINYAPPSDKAILCISDVEIQSVPKRLWGKVKGYDYDTQRHIFYKSITIRKGETIKPNDWVYISRNYKNFLIVATDIDESLYFSYNYLPTLNVDVKDIHLYRLSVERPKPPFISFYNDFVWCYTNVNVLLRRVQALLSTGEGKIILDIVLQDLYLIVNLLISEIRSASDNIIKTYNMINKLYALAMNPGTIAEGKNATKRCIDRCMEFINLLNLKVVD